VVISPDLTTNDTLKQKYNRSGGLTFDVTGAENHTTILAISPSPAEKGVIWVGTDDGNIQLTTDGGGSWINCSPRIGELPSGAWIPQIVPSLKNEGEAWVVVNNYRLNDYAPYLFHTTDFGKKWSRQLDATDVQGYVLSFAQDPEEPRLQFLGTECGLFVTIDGGARWTRWTSGFPTVPTMDLVIHPREHDLVIGTFGRSAYIIDDLTPLRALARDYGKITSGGVRVLEPPVATLAESRSAPGYYFTGDAYFKGENRSPGAMISYFAAVEENIQGKKDSVTIQVLDGEMNLVRTLKSVPENGLNRITWSLDRKGVRLNFSESGSSEGMQGRRGRTAGGEPGGGGNVLPGTYNIRLSFQGDTSLTSVLVVPDPRTDYDLEGMEAKQEKADRLLQKMDALNNGMARIRECRERYQLVEKIAGKDPSEEMVAASALVKKQLDEISGKLFRDESIQGIYYPSDALYVQLSGTGSILGGNRPLTPNQNQKLDQYMSLADGAIEMINHFLDTGWSAYREAVNREGVSLFEE
jgi:hypothetical protein